jgi:predicted nucleic acid-binding protein
VRWAVIDTSVYINYWERGLHDAALADVRRAFIIRHSSVVLSELRRGARTMKARRLVEGLFQISKVQWTPTGVDWWTAGRLIRSIGDRFAWDTAKRRDFQNDCLIALTARRHGAAIVAADRTDFGLLAKEVRVRVLFV